MRMCFPLILRRQLSDAVGSLAKAGEWEAARLLVYLTIKGLGSDSDYERSPEIALRLAQLARPNVDRNSSASWSVLIAAAALLDQTLAPPTGTRFGAHSKAP